MVNHGQTGKERSNMVDHSQKTWLTMINHGSSKIKNFVQNLICLFLYAALPPNKKNSNN